MLKKYPYCISYILLAIPIALLLLFFLGEVIDGETGGFIHILQILPLILLAILALKRPHTAGILLVILGILLGGNYIVSAKQFPIQTILFVEILFFFPAIIAGVFLLSLHSTQKKKLHYYE